MKSVITIHNLKFQGVWDVKTIQRFTELPDYYFTPDKLEAYKDGNLLKGGIVYADAITTVSNTYAEEIKMPFYGEGLDGLMRARSNSLRGIVNGIDYGEFNPETDRYIAQNYNAKNFRREKGKNKKALQQELGLPIDEKKFMVGIVSRLTDQKGLDLIQGVMDEICSEDMQLIILGTGDERYENMFRHYDWKYHDRVSAQIYYSEAMSHKIYAACDAFLMPSLFEPCGLSQLMALRYGTVPIVRETGGLKDTVWPYNEYESTGTGFSLPIIMLTRCWGASAMPNTSTTADAGSGIRSLTGRWRPISHGKHLLPDIRSCMTGSSADDREKGLLCAQKEVRCPWRTLKQMYI